MQIYFAGIMRAVMKEKTAVVICTITEFFIGIPVAYWLAYEMKFGVIGIWFKNFFITLFLNLRLGLDGILVLC